MGRFVDEHDLSFEEYLSPFAPPASRDARPIPALSWDDGPFVPAEAAEHELAADARPSDYVLEEPAGDAADTEGPEGQETRQDVESEEFTPGVEGSSNGPNPTREEPAPDRERWVSPLREWTTTATSDWRDAPPPSGAEAGEQRANGFEEPGEIPSEEPTRDPHRLPEADDETSWEAEQGVVSPRIAAALGDQNWSLALQFAIEEGWRDDNELTNLVFFARHPDLGGRALDPHRAGDAALGRDWAAMRDREVWPAIEKSARNVALAVSGRLAAAGYRQFWGKSGQQFKSLVEDAARQVALDPGLLASSLLAETDRGSYLTASPVSSYRVGTDDFYERRHALARAVPAYRKVGWDKNQTAQVHLNDARKPRQVQTIYFDSGRDALLASAVYLKYGETVLRSFAAERGRNFDDLPAAVRFALSRIAFAAGPAGARRRLEHVLDGADILVRNDAPLKPRQTDRNATIRAAQAIHLAEWVFKTAGPAVSPALPRPAPVPEVEPEIEPEAWLEAEPAAGAEGEQSEWWTGDGEEPEAGVETESLADGLVDRPGADLDEPAGVRHGSPSGELRLPASSPWPAGQGGRIIRPVPLARRCGFFSLNGNVLGETTVRDAIVEAAVAEQDFWRSGGTLQRETVGGQFGHLVRYWLHATQQLPSANLMSLAQRATDPSTSYGQLLGPANVPDANIERDARQAASDLVVGVPVNIPPNLERLVVQALLNARRSSAPSGVPKSSKYRSTAWSGVFVNTCVREAEFNLLLEAPFTGGPQELLALSSLGRHWEYTLAAHQRRFGCRQADGTFDSRGQRDGTYHAFAPSKRAVQNGDIIVQDRQPDPQKSTPRDVWTFARIPFLTQGRDLHGDIVVDVQAGFAETIGGNVDDSVRRRRYPLDPSGQLVVAANQLYVQENDAGMMTRPKTKGVPLESSSTRRIFALLSLVEACRIVPGEPAPAREMFA